MSRRPEQLRLLSPMWSSWSPAGPIHFVPGLGHPKEKKSAVHMSPQQGLEMRNSEFYGDDESMTGGAARRTTNKGIVYAIVGFANGHLAKVNISVLRLLLDAVRSGASARHNKSNSTPSSLTLFKKMALTR